MQPFLIKVTVPQKESFTINRYAYKDCFPGVWHFHDEYEMTLIIESDGTRMVGDHIERFDEGDLVFIGKGLPHTWRNNDFHTFKNAEALVLHFTEQFCGASFFEIPEMAKIHQLMCRSHVGLRVEGMTRKKSVEIMFEMEKTTGANRLILLLSLLNLLANSDELRNLASEGFANVIEDPASDRLRLVYEYVMNNFQDDISLVKVAAIANMSPTAFSRYFKNRTRKSFSRFLIELKIGFACKLLMKEDTTVTHACYGSGFQNLSNFNQQFKIVTGFTPKKYQLLHAG